MRGFFVLILCLGIVFSAQAEVVLTGLYLQRRAAVNVANYLMAGVINKGKNIVKDIEIRFYKGKVSKKRLIGVRRIKQLLPRQIKVAKILWAPVKQGKQRLIAVYNSQKAVLEFSCDIKLDGIRPPQFDWGVLHRKNLTDLISKVKVPEVHLDAVKKPDKVGDVREFWTSNIKENKNEKIEAVCKYVGKHCYIYLEKGQKVSDSVIKKIGKEFDEVVYPVDTATFGEEPRPGIDQDKRLTILLLDIKDDYETTGSYVGGYFSMLNEYTQKALDAYNAQNGTDFKSNEREMFYMDINPGDPKDIKQFCGTLAHEFQHMIHFNQDPMSDTWINEACSQYATYICGYGHPNQIKSFLRNPDTSLVNWGGGVDSYGAVYLFLYYILKKIVVQTNVSEKEFLNTLVAFPQKRGRVPKVLNKLLREFTNKKFDKIFEDWVVANLIDNPHIKNGEYGYDKNLKLSRLGAVATTKIRNVPFENINEDVKPYAADYYCFTTAKPQDTEYVKPVNPSIDDTITFSYKRLAKLVWGINGYNTPPKVYWTKDTKLRKSGAVGTPLHKKGSEYAVTLGPFNKTLGVQCLDFTFVFEDGTWIQKYCKIEFRPKKPLAQVASKTAFKFRGSIPKANYKVIVVKKSAKDIKVNSMLMSSGTNKGEYKLSGLGTNYKEFYFIVTAAYKFSSPCKYSYAAVTKTGKVSLTSIKADFAELRILYKNVKGEEFEKAVSDFTDNSLKNLSEFSKFITYLKKQKLNNNFKVKFKSIVNQKLFNKIQLCKESGDFEKEEILKEIIESLAEL